MAADPAFAAYENAVGELQLVDLAKLEPVERRSFVINLYNAIVPHAFAKLGIPDKDLARVTFFDGVSYELGGWVCVLAASSIVNPQEVAEDGQSCRRESRRLHAVELGQRRPTHPNLGLDSSNSEPMCAEIGPSSAESEATSTDLEELRPSVCPCLG